MNRLECISEKISARTLGVLLLPLAFVLAFICMLLMPVVGFLFSLPLFILSIALIFAPESKACRLIVDSAKKPFARGSWTHR